MKKPRIMLVGISLKATAINALTTAGLSTTVCQDAFDALAKLNNTAVEAMIVDSDLTGLTACQLCCLIKSNDTSSSLPFLLVYDKASLKDNQLAHLPQPDAIITAKDLQGDGHRLVKLVKEQIQAGKRLGWKSEPVSILPTIDTILAGADSSQRYDRLLDDLLTERLTGKIARDLIAAIQPHKRFLQSYFAAASKFINADLMGIAIGSLHNPWTAFQGQAGLSEAAFNEIVAQVKTKLSLTDQLTLDINVDIAASGKPVMECHILPVPTSVAGSGVLIFAQYQGGNKFNQAQLAAMNFLTIQMQPVMHLLLAQQEIENFHTREVYNASTDQLTGLYNLQFLLGFLQQQLLFSSRNKLSVGLLIMDIDNFAAINSSLGTQTGDVLLMKLAAHLLKTTRASDLSARYGGDEFAIILPNTDLHGAQVLAEKLRLEVEQLAFLEEPLEPKSHITVSIGCAQFDLQDLNPETILAQAKSSLQKAKAAGKNRVVAS